MRPGPKPGAHTCFVNLEETQARQAVLAKAAPGFQAPAVPLTYNVAVIRIDFYDNQTKKTYSEVEDLFGKFQDYYRENSYGILTVTSTISDGGTGVHGAYRMPHSQAFYADGIYTSYDRLVSDAVRVATSAGFNFSSFDHVMILHSGDGAETTNDDNIWSVYLPSSYLNGPEISGKAFHGLTVIPESEGMNIDPLGTICHEYAHQLGLPDLYNTRTANNVVGVWSLMDFGSYVGTPPGSKPAHLDAWSKQFLGFAAPKTVSFSWGSAEVLSQSETSRTAFLRLPIHSGTVGGDKEYFLLEYRRRTGATFDGDLPGEGLLIWHIDDSVASDPQRLSRNTVNAGGPHYGVKLVTADFSTPYNNGGDSGDPWSGQISSSRFCAPKSNSYSADDSGVAVENISPAGGLNISMTVKNLSGNSAVVKNAAQGGIVVVGGANGTVNPDAGESAYVVVSPDQAGPIGVQIFSVRGDLIAEKNADSEAHQQKTIAWDCKTSEGRVVDSGIYFVRVKHSGITSTKKVAVIR